MHVSVKALFFFWGFRDSCENVVFLLSQTILSQHRNQRMAEDQSVVGRRQIYYDKEHGSEALVYSDTDDEMTEPEEVKRAFSGGEDRILS